jgi:hypothetical protein
MASTALCQGTHPCSTRLVGQTRMPSRRRLPASCALCTRHSRARTRRPWAASPGRYRLPLARLFPAMFLEVCCFLRDAQWLSVRQRLAQLWIRMGNVGCTCSVRHWELRRPALGRLAVGLLQYGAHPTFLAACTVPACRAAFKYCLSVRVACFG